MQRSKLIYDLIQSMTPPEKRYVLRHLRHFREESNHVELFKALDQQQEYDPDKLRSQLGDSGAGRHLDVAKVQLYDICLRHLRAYYEGSVTEVRMKAMIGECRLLISRRMYAHARRRLMQLKVVAERHFYFLEQLEINSYLRELLHIDPKDVSLYEGLKKLNEENERILSHYLNFRFYSDAAELASVCGRIDGSPSFDQATEELMQVLQDPRFESEEQALTFPAKRLFCYVQAYSAHLNLKSEQAVYYNKRQVELLEERKELQPELYTTLISALYNLLIDYYTLGRCDEALDMVLRMRTLPETMPVKLAKNESLRRKLLFRVTNMELAVLTRMGQFEPEAIAWKELEEVLLLLDKGIEKALGIELRYGAALFCYGIGDYRQALRFLTTIINDSPPEMLILLQGQARILQLIVYREGRNDQHTYTSWLRHTRKWLTEKDQWSSTANVLIPFLEFEVTNTDPPEWRKRLAELVEEIDREVNSGTAHNLFDYGAWGTAVLQNRRFAEVMQERYQQRRAATAN